MLKFKLFTILLCMTAIPSLSAEQGNVLVYTDPVQVTTEISPYESLTENSPIKGTLMVTHDATLKVDISSFRIGSDPLKVELEKEVSLSSTNNLLISIYKFELPGKPKGSYNLSPMSVKVGGKEYQAPSLNIVIGE